MVEEVQAFKSIDGEIYGSKKYAEDHDKLVRYMEKFAPLKPDNVYFDLKEAAGKKAIIVKIIEQGCSIVDEWGNKV